jgi:nitrogen fixation/metabolism regulation signal transduction histidine kinase
MSVTSDILASWRAPRAVIRRHLARGRSEPFAFSLLVAFLVLAFVAMWPRLSRLAVITPEASMVQGLVGTGLGLLATIPLFYVVAAASHAFARAFGGRGGYYGARIALFLALLAVSPLVLLSGVTLGFMGQGAQSLLTGGAAFAAFMVIWVNMLIEAET